MSAALGRVFCLGREPFLKEMPAGRLISLTFEASRKNPVCSVGSQLVNCFRHYRANPTHGIGRYKYLLPKNPPEVPILRKVLLDQTKRVQQSVHTGANQGPLGSGLYGQVSKKRWDRVQMKEIDPGTEHTYGFLNIVMTAYDMALVEHYARYIHRLCSQLSIRVEESYAMPTKIMEVMQMQQQGSKMYLDAVLSTHQRIVQINGLSATFAPILLEIIQNNQPEGLHLLVKEHTEDDFKGRLKARPELEELLSQMG